jgi:hypothetical protein
MADQFTADIWVGSEVGYLKGTVVRYYFQILL